MEKMYWSEIQFFPDGFNHDGIEGGTQPGFLAAFRFTEALILGTHTWSLSFTDKTGLVTLNDSGTVIVQLRRRDLVLGKL